ncbi:hypothetical protein pf16_167 [Pseudomonas phage pf16]|uniref:Uncharacterized protein n=1 Tax=Pseudomonas phage pf16 TaxID=1815630 RepID=A0A1S5R639_9CAUD|nr:hypothetical protein FDG98_gp131 [Pseudomonas phage pf16]AND75090.1 hypothetical protein pf16_167 [Pseudomonas phage pf16]
MHGMRRVRLVDEHGEKITEYSAVTHPAVGERIQYNDQYFVAWSVLHALRTGRDGGGEYVNLDIIIIKVKQELPY